MIKLTPAIEAEAARLAVLHGWSLDVVRGFALGRMHDATLHGADEPRAQELTLRGFERDLIWTLDPDPLCELCGEPVPGDPPSSDGGRPTCDGCKRKAKAERIAVVEAARPVAPVIPIRKPSAS